MPRQLPARGGTDWQRAQAVAVDATALRHRRGILVLRYWRWFIGLPLALVAVGVVGKWASGHLDSVGMVGAVVIVAVVAFAIFRPHGGYRKPRELR
jgi:bacteriorhodopsin